MFNKGSRLKGILLASALILSAGICKAEIDWKYNLVPGFKAATSVAPSSFTIVSAGGGLTNCLNNFSLMSTTLSNMSILEGTLQSGTTIWGLMSVPAGTVVNVPSGDNESALCGGANTQLVIVVSSGAVSMNYRGYVRGRP